MNMFVFFPNRSLLFAFAEDTESREQRQTKISFPTWLYRTVSYLRSYKYRDNCRFVYRNICCLKWGMQWIILFLTLFCRGNI